MATGTANRELHTIHTVIASKGGREDHGLKSVLDKTAKSCLFNEVINALKSCNWEDRKVKLKATMKEKAQKNHWGLKSLACSDSVEITPSPFRISGSQLSSFWIFCWPVLLIFKPHAITSHSSSRRRNRCACGYVGMKQVWKGESSSICWVSARYGNDSSFYDYTRRWVGSSRIVCCKWQYGYVYSVEVKVQQLLPRHLSHGGNKPLCTVIGFWCWLLLAVDINSEKYSSELLKVVVESWVTMGGFALTSMWKEQYKRTTAKNLKNGKSLRKETEKETETDID